MAGEEISEAAVQYRPLFADADVEKGEYSYRVLARNQAGLSPPSNVVGPVRVEGADPSVERIKDMASRRLVNEIFYSDGASAHAAIDELGRIMSVDSLLTHGVAPYLSEVVDSGQTLLGGEEIRCLS